MSNNKDNMRTNQITVNKHEHNTKPQTRTKESYTNIFSSKYDCRQDSICTN